MHQDSKWSLMACGQLRRLYAHRGEAGMIPLNPNRRFHQAARMIGIRMH